MATVVKNPPANAGDAGDMGLIPGWGRSSEGNGNPHQMLAWKIRGPWQSTVHAVAESDTTD